MPKLNSVVSSTIEAVGYEADPQTLHVRFKNGTVFLYKDVPEKLYQQLMEAESIGKFFAAKIKPKYIAEKQDENQERPE